MDGDIYIALGEFGSRDPADPLAQQLAAGTRFQQAVISGLEPGQRHVVRGTTSRMPFKNNYAHEIVTPNFGDPAIDDVERFRRAAEFARVLRPAGRLTVVETLKTSVFTPEDLADFLASFTFRPTNKGQERDPYTLDNYADANRDVGFASAFVLSSE